MSTFSIQRATLLLIALSSLMIGCSPNSTDEKIATETVQHAPDLPSQPPATAAGAASSAPEPNIPPTPPPKPIIIPGGTLLVVTVDQPLSSKTSQAGQTFLATVAKPVAVHGKNAIPKGSSVVGNVVAAKAKGKIKGQGELALKLTSISIYGKTYPIHTSTFSSTVKGKGKRTAKTTGGGAAGGALIGGIAGGGKGAGIGALVGAGAGLVGGALTGNDQVEINSESPLTFTLSEPLTLPPARISSQRPRARRKEPTR